MFVVEEVMLGFKTILKDSYFDVKVGELSLRYNLDYLREKIKEGITFEVKHDLLKAYYEDNDIPYLATGILNAKLLYFFRAIECVVFQNKILNYLVKELETDEKDSI